MAEKDPQKKKQSELAGNLMTDMLTVLQNPGALPPLAPPTEGAQFSITENAPGLKMPQTPSAPEEPPPPGTGTQIARAAAVFMAAAGGNPELASMLSARFAQQDQLAAERVQQDFANKMAIVQAQRQELTFAAEQEQQAYERKQTREERALQRQQLQQQRTTQQWDAALTALNLVERQKENELASTSDASAAQILNLELDQIKLMRQSLEQRVKEAGVEIPSDLAKNPLAQINVLGQEEWNRIMRSGGSTYEAALAKLEGRQARAIETAKGQMRGSPAYQTWRNTLTPNGQFLADMLMGSAPDPVTGDPGNQPAFSESVVGLASETTKDGQNALIAASGELAKQMVAQGSFATIQDAEEFFATLLHDGVAPDQWMVHIPPAGTIRRDLRRQPPEAFTPSPGLKRTTLRGQGPPPKPLPVRMKGGR